MSEKTHVSAEPVAFVCAADLELLAKNPEGLDLSVSPRPRPDLGMNTALYAKSHNDAQYLQELKPCPICGSDEASTYIGAPGPGVVTCFAVGCGHTIKGFASNADAIAEWNKRSDAMSAAMTEAYCSEGTEDDTLKECFLHHVRTTIGFLAFGMRTGPEMTMYEEGFKAGYRRCQSDNEPELGEDEDILNERTRNVVAKLRESLRNGKVDPLAIDNAVDLLIDQSQALDASKSPTNPPALSE